ncbi:hypothetical protein ACFQ9X_12560 [Catenulispora yoronensis]
MATTRRPAHGLPTDRKLAETAADDAVQMAEQLVLGAWIAELHAATEDADTAVRAALHLRAMALSDLRQAQLSGIPQHIVDAQQAVEAADRDLAESRATQDGVRDLLARELADQPCASQVRLLPDRRTARETTAFQRTGRSTTARRT